MNTGELAALIKSIGAVISQHVGAALKPLHGRLNDVEWQVKVLADAPKPKNGEDGKSVTIDDVAPLIKAAVDAIPHAQDGKSVTLDEVAPLIEKAMAAIPRPENGKDGATADEIKALISAAVASLPKPQDGKSVTLDEVKGFLGESMGSWEVNFERHAQRVLERAIERMPKPQDGRDGVGWDDMIVEHDGKRQVSFIFKKGANEYRADIVIPCVIDAGFYQDGMAVEKGDGVTFGGSYWIAQKDTNTKPELGNPDYRLAVKKGRDGKNADRLETRPVIQVPA
ncbi:MAG: hypothetical protein WC710_13750 [Gallionella sp.]|jgi:hypothetical protein